MSALAEFRRLDGTGRRLILETLAVVPAVRIALSILSFRSIQRAFQMLKRRAPSSAVSPERIAWAVSAIDRRGRRSSCLIRAFAATLLLIRYGHPVTLRLGVADRDGKLAAHAWVEFQGRALLDAPGDGEFVALPPFPTEWAQTRVSVPPPQRL